MIPILLRMRIGSGRGRGFGLWLPIFLIWLLLFVIFLVLLPFMVLAEVILAAAGKYIPIIGIFWYALWIMTKLHGTEIHVDDPDDTTKVDISIY